MTTKNSVFADSNFWIALYNSHDTLHDKARLAAERVAQEDCKVVLSNYVLLEVLTVLSQRVDRQLALTVGDSLSDASHIEVLHITKALHERSWEVFRQTARKNLSFVDCSIVAAMNYAGVKRLLTFDTTDFSPLRKQFAFTLFE